VVVTLAVLAIAILGSAANSRAENEGLAELDEATQLKLTAKTFADLGKVADLCESAMAKGLDDANRKFAVRLITASMMQRASGAAESILGKAAPDPRWPMLRRFALADLERAVKHDAKFAPAHLLIGKLQALPGGDREKAKKALDDAVAYADGDDAKAEALVARADFGAEAAKRTADYNEAVKLAPRDAQVIRARGLFYLGGGDHKSALADLDESLRLDPKQPDTHESRGIALMMLNRLDDALAAMNKAIELSPATSGFFVNRARIQALKNDVDKALADINEALRLEPNEVLALLLRARLYQAKGQPSKAMDDVEQALRRRPGLVAALELRAALLAAAGKYNEAIAEMERIVAADPDDMDRVLQLGFLYVAAKKPRKAVEKFSLVVARDAKSAVALHARGDALLSLGKHAEAIADYDVAVKLAPNDTGILNNLAWVLATSPVDKLRNGQRSIETAKRACELTQYKKPHILSTLAAGYAESGDWAKAVEWSQKAVDMGDENYQQQLQAELDSYKKHKPWRELQNEDEQQPPKKDDPSGPHPPEPPSD
jgi:tetratricopeptide (TPR) repeat protein